MYEELCKPWWNENKEKVAKSVRHVFKTLFAEDAGRRYDNDLWLSHYLNKPINMHNASPHEETEALAPRLLDNKIINISKQIVDTSRVKLGKVRPRATFLVSGGDHRLRRQAYQFEKAMDGWHWKVGVYQKIFSLITDMQIYGKGIWHIYRHKDDIKLDRVHPNEILVDPEEAKYQTPRSLYRARRVSKDMLIAQFPGKKSQIRTTKGEIIHQTRVDGDEEGRYVTEMVDVIEAWHLPSGKDSKDGRHVITTESVTLLDEAWIHPRFPFVMVDWEPPATGFWGQGMVELVAPIDQHFNEMLQRISTAASRGTSPMVFVDEGSIAKEEFNNDICNIYYVRPEARDPRFVVPNAINQELFRYVDWLQQQGFEVPGVSRMNATSSKPAGITAAVAIRELNDLHSERFMIQNFHIENIIVQSTHIILDILEEAAVNEEDGMDLSVKVINGGALEKLDFKELKIDRDQFYIKVFPTSALPMSPAAKKNEIEELIQTGMVSQEEAYELKAHPDVEAFYQRRSAQRRAMERIIERILEDGEYVAPETFMTDLPDKINQVRDAYMQAIIEDVPNDKLALLRRWVLEAEKILNPPQPSVSSPAAPQEGPMVQEAEGLDQMAGTLPGVPIGPGAGLTAQ